MIVILIVALKMRILLILMILNLHSINDSERSSFYTSDSYAMKIKEIITSIYIYKNKKNPKVIFLKIEQSACNLWIVCFDRK